MLPYYGYEARSYAIYCMLAALSLWMWTRFADDHRWAAVGFGVVLFVAVTMHYYAVLLLVPYGLWELLRWRPRQLPSPKLIAGMGGVLLALALVKQIIKAGGKLGVPQGGPFSPLAANIYLNEVDWAFDAIRRKTAEGPYEAVNYHRFADDIVITVSGHHPKRGWAERALQRLHEQFAPLGVELNKEKTKVVDTLNGEAFGFLGFDLRRTPKRKGNGHYIQMTPKKKACKAIKAKVRDIVQHSGATPMPKVVAQINASIAGWVNYFRVGNASGAFSEVRDYTEMKVRSLLTRRKRRRKTSVGWRRWSNEYLYRVLGLYWDWKVRPLPGVESMP